MNGFANGTSQNLIEDRPRRKNLRTGITASRSTTTTTNSFCPLQGSCLIKTTDHRANYLHGLTRYGRHVVFTLICLSFTIIKTHQS
jgi:hypothetical protein